MNSANVFLLQFAETLLALPKPKMHRLVLTPVALPMRLDAIKRGVVAIAKDVNYNWKELARNLIWTRDDLREGRWEEFEPAFVDLCIANLEAVFLMLVEETPDFSHKAIIMLDDLLAAIPPVCKS